MVKGVKEDQWCHEGSIRVIHSNWDILGQAQLLKLEKVGLSEVW